MDKQTGHQTKPNGDKRDGNWHENYRRNRTLGQRASDGVARVMGSWTFVLSWAVMVLFWLVFNVVVARRLAFDAPPFILLNLVLGIPVFFGAPLIMMAQNRQEGKDRRKAERDYANDASTRKIVELLHNTLERMEAEKLDPLIEKVDKLYEQTTSKATDT